MQRRRSARRAVIGGASRLAAGAAVLAPSDAGNRLSGAAGPGDRPPALVAVAPRVSPQRRRQRTRRCLLWVGGGAGMHRTMRRGQGRSYRFPRWSTPRLAWLLHQATQEDHQAAAYAAEAMLGRSRSLIGALHQANRAVRDADCLRLEAVLLRWLQGP